VTATRRVTGPADTSQARAGGRSRCRSGGRAGSRPVTDAERLTITLADYAADVEAVVDWLGAPACVVGHSMGGIVSQVVAQRRQLRADACRLHCTWPARSDSVISAD
jgi:predicted alpha/beta hydrolase